MQPHPNNYVNISKHLNQMNIKDKAPYKINIGTVNRPNYRAVKQPNQNLMIILEIEDLISKVNDKLEELPEDICRLSYQFKSQAIEEIDLFQKTTLFDLRKAVE